MKTLIAAVFLLFAIHANAADFTYHGNKVDVLIDVRTPEEFASGHIDGAINLPYDQIDAKNSAVAAIDKGRSILVYCRSGRRSAIARDNLQQLGYRQVLDGGAMSATQSSLKHCKGSDCQ